MINNHYIKLIIILSFIFYLGCKIGQGPPPPIPQVSLTASTSSIIVGDSLTLAVNVVNVDELFATSFQITFDTSYVHINTLYPDSLHVENISNMLYGPVVFLDDSFGMLSVALSGNNLSGNIHSFIVKGVKSTSPGTTEFEIVDMELIQTDGTDVPDFSSLILIGVEITVIDTISAAAD